MKKTSRIFLPLAVGAVAAVSGFLVAQDKDDQPAPLVIKSDSTAIERTGGTHPTSYAPMLADAKKAVVSVATAEVVRYARGGGRGSMEDRILRQLFGMPAPRNQGNGQVQEEKVPQGVGSGVIISPDGYILTNNHVISTRDGGEADEILVRMSDDTEMEAKLIGRDPQTDIAVIKVDGKDLPHATVANSEEIMVGDIVFAIGNPMGVGLTVTSGIVSATGRSIGIYGRDGYEDFIQTDAAINRGNSGGALIDIEGRLIGINSAIVSSSGGSNGLGFAIPANLAVDVAQRLTETGEVKRGYIGIRMSPLEPEVAEAMGAKGVKGVLIEEVIDGFPAKEAGLQHGDIITSINGNAITNPNDLRLAVASTALGDTLKVTVRRDGKDQEFEVQVADPEESLALDGQFVEGVQANLVNDSLRETYGIPSEVSGLVVTEVAPGSPFARYLQPGLVILEINKREVESLDQARELLRDQGNNLLYVYYQGRTRYFALRLN
ncbi:Do family serine endopeptidase [Roseibacillus ishigakijimensis]|uniref:Do family serine endopeptidase n=1 Tax=Roseibacillus ishigakijimensis TaxID=454146 RepID=A0A934RTM1_9BACT|nr:Do family serine endopeptidase [Roseibacillus ishigakijimensis]MBK1835421.1 Do family serine endopeptidase [Roseibacillus ishigakijimensis]